MNNEDSPETPEFFSMVLVGEYRNAFLSQLNENRCVNHLCDVTLVVQGREFRAHRAVLAASGGFFRGLFAADMREKSENTVQLSEVDVDVVEDLLEFIYTGRIFITRDSAQALAIAADFLLLEQLKSSVDEFLATYVSAYCPSITTDVVPLCLFASQYKCRTLERNTIKMIRANFESLVAESPDFLDLNAEVLQSVITGDDLKVTNEELVVRAVIDWVKHKEERKDVFQDLFSKVRLCSLSEEFLNSFLVNEPLITHNPSSMRLVLSSMKVRYGPGTPTAPNKEHPRDCLDLYTDAILIFLKRKSDSDYHGPWCYVPLQNKWYEIPTTSENHGYGKPVYYQDKGLLYLLRNHNQNPDNIIIDSYNLESKAWSNVASFHMPIKEYNVVCLNGVFYFIGGEKFTSRKDVTPVDYVYSLEIEKMPTINYSNTHFTHVSTLNQCRADPYVVASERYVYVLGGYINTYRKYNLEPVCTNTVERYDPLTKTCENLSAMKYTSYCGQCSITRNKIFVLHSRTSDLCAIELYNIDTDIWATIKQLQLELEVSTTVLNACNDHLYLIGNKSCKFEVLEYNTEYGASWQLHKSPVRVGSRRISELVWCLDGTVVRLPKKMLSSFKRLNP